MTCASLDALAREGLGSWRGLAADARLDAVATTLGADLGLRALDRLGERTAMHASGTLAGAEARVWWLPHDDDAVALVELLNPAWDPSDLGEPAARLDTYDGELEAPGGELVWPDRGAAAILGRGGAIATLRLFPPTTLDDYAENLRPDITPRRLP